MKNSIISSNVESFISQLDTMSGRDALEFLDAIGAVQYIDNVSRPSWGVSFEMIILLCGGFRGDTKNRFGVKISEKRRIVYADSNESGKDTAFDSLSKFIDHVRELSGNNRWISQEREAA